MNYEMPLLRYSGVLEVLQSESDTILTRESINMMHHNDQIPPLAVSILEAKTEEFLLCGFLPTIDPLSLSELEKKVLLFSSVNKKVEEEKTKISVAYALNENMILGLSKLFSSAIKTLVEVLVSEEPDKKKNAERAIESLGKSHIERAIRERMASGSTT